MATTTLLQIKSAFWEKQGLLWSGTATGGSAKLLADSSLQDLASDQYPFPVRGKQIRMTSGLASGDLRRVVKTDETDAQLFPNRDFSAAVASTDTYELWGAGIHGGARLTNLINEAIRPRRPVKQTQVTIVTNQSRYDVTSLVRTRDDILNVWERVLDPNSLRPYTPRPLEWWAEDHAGGGTATAVYLFIRPLTLDATVHELWVEHRTSFAAFSTSADTGTVDAVYKDWLAYEALYLYAQRGKLTPNADGLAWDALELLAAEGAQQGRNEFEPRRPIRIRATGSLVGY